MFYKRLEKTKPLVGSREEWQKERQRIEENHLDMFFAQWAVRTKRCAAAGQEVASIK